MLLNNIKEDFSQRGKIKALRYKGKEGKVFRISGFEEDPSKDFLYDSLPKILSSSNKHIVIETPHLRDGKEIFLPDPSAKEIFLPDLSINNGLLWFSHHCPITFFNNRCKEIYEALNKRVTGINIPKLPYNRNKDEFSSALDMLIIHLHCLVNNVSNIKTLHIGGFIGIEEARFIGLDRKLMSKFKKEDITCSEKETAIACREAMLKSRESLDLEV